MGLFVKKSSKIEILRAFEKKVFLIEFFADFLAILKKFKKIMGSSAIRRSGRLSGKVLSGDGARKPVLGVPWGP